MDWISNKCGGVRFRTLPNFKIEIEDVGIPSYPKTSPEFQQLQDTWKNWKSLIRKYSKKHGIPPSYLLAIATKETGLWSYNKTKQASVGSPAGAVGIMQIMPCSVFRQEPFKTLVCTADRTNPSSSFEIGSLLLSKHLNRFNGELLPAASAYNAGDLYCYSTNTNPGVVANRFNWKNEHDYATKVATFNNTAIDLGVNKASALPWILGTSILAGSVIALLHTNTLQLPRPLR